MRVLLGAVTVFFIAATLASAGAAGDCELWVKRLGVNRWQVLCEPTNGCPQNTRPCQWDFWIIANAETLPQKSVMFGCYCNDGSPIDKPCFPKWIEEPNGLNYGLCTDPQGCAKQDCVTVDESGIPVGAVARVCWCGES